MRYAMMMTVLALAATTAMGATFYVDPVNGSPSGDGSAANPWLTIEQVINDGLIESWASGSVPINPGAPVTGGDTILLRSGYHGEIILDGYYNRKMITIAAEEGHTPKIKRIRMGFYNADTGAKAPPGSFWTFRGLTISPSFAPVYEQVTLIDIYSRFVGISRHVVIEDCTLYSVLDTSGWSASDWVTKACHGIRLGSQGQNLTARRNHLLNVDFGIFGQSDDSLVEYNEIVNFSGDGIRSTGDGTVYQYNVIKNCFNVDDNHDDGIQGFHNYASGTPIYDVVLRGNVIIEREDPNQPLQGALQAIGCFDGMFMNWLVENNVCLNTHWHGITLMGADNCTVVNNTVYNQSYMDRTVSRNTWIEISRLKSMHYANDPRGLDGICRDVIVRNNIAHRYNLYPGDHINLVRSNNLGMGLGEDEYAWFVDPPNFDVHLAPGSPAIDAGTNTDAPGLDADELFRPIGLTTDAGAYEYGSKVPVAADAGDDHTIIDANGDGWEPVTLDGSGSYSFYGPITDYTWTQDGSYLGSGASILTVLPVGQYTVTLTINTDTGETDTDDVVITVTGQTAVPGDCDGDGDVDLDDFTIVKQNFGRTDVTGGRAEGDLDEDGDVDLDDFSILKQNFGTTS
ncbi:MAG: choice-of-anchor Q domain-containing protein [Planctomycetota bacterium]